MNTKISKTESEWKRSLTAGQYAILRNKETEPAFSGKHLHNHDDGIFTCAGCGAKLFHSNTKFDSGSGWPSFDEATEGSVTLIDDDSHGMYRTEVVCSNCGSHLGHIFDDGPTNTGKQYCVNSISLDHEEE